MRTHRDCGDGLKRLIITGANGAGKSRFAAELALVRPDTPVISLDALKLLTDWLQRPRSETVAALAKALEADTWILEGGQSLLPQAVGRAAALVWLDPPEHVRAWQLAKRPWMFSGQTRPELPSGNVDWPWQQYRFALRSLRNTSKFRTHIADVFDKADGVQKWRCRTAHDRDDVVAAWVQNR